MKKLIVFLLVCTVGLAQSVSVRRNLTANGTLLGAVAGAIIGNNNGHGNGAQGALIGAAAGAILGNAAADAQGAPPYRGDDPVIGGAVLGGVTGAIIGNNSGHGNGARGALIGAAAGTILGRTANDRSAPRSYYGNPYGRSHLGSSRPHGYGSYGTDRSYPAYGRTYDRGDAVASGLLFGGLAGAIIGNNSGHGNGARGALIGAGIGALLGATSEPAPRDYYEQPEYYTVPPTHYVQQMQQMQTMQRTPQQVTVINNYYVTVSPASGGYKTDTPAY